MPTNLETLASVYIYTFTFANRDKFKCAKTFYFDKFVFKQSFLNGIEECSHKTISRSFIYALVLHYVV